MADEYGPDDGDIYERGHWTTWLSSKASAGTIGPMYMWLGDTSPAERIKTISGGVTAIGPSDETYDPEWAAFLGSENV